MAIINIPEFHKLMNQKQLFLPFRWDGVHIGQHLREFVFPIYKTSIASIVGTRESEKYYRVCEEIERIIDYYYNGFPCLSYSRFKTLMELLWREPIRVYDKTSWGDFFDDNDPLKLYRIRKTKERGIFSRKDVFHTPFNRRYRVAACRYSIAGYPSLYLSTSLQLSNLELSGVYDVPPEGIASRFQLIRNMRQNRAARIKVIELAIKPQNFKKEDKYKSEQGYNDMHVTKLDEINLNSEQVMKSYLLWYPLIAACSAICTSKDNPFCSEYIIPQLLSQWLRDEFKDDIFIGIRYFSCRSVEASKRGINYMFPTRYVDSNSVYCDVLGNAFKLTAPINMKNFASVEDCEEELNRDMNLATIYSTINN